MNNGTQKDVAQRIIDAAATPRTSKELAEATGLAESSVRQRLVKLREGNPKKIFISGWRKVPGQTLEQRLYQAGDSDDVPYHYRAKKPYVPAMKIELSQDLPDDGWRPRRVCKDPVNVKRDWSVAALFGEYRGVAA